MRCPKCSGIMLREGKWNREKQDYEETGTYICCICGHTVKNLSEEDVPEMIKSEMERVKG